MGSKEIRHDTLGSKAHEDSNLKEGSRIEGASTFTDIVETATVKEVTNETAVKRLNMKSVTIMENPSLGKIVMKMKLQHLERLRA